MRSRGRSVFLVGATLVLSGVVALVVGELIVRAFVYFPEVQPDPNVIRSLPENRDREVRTFDTIENRRRAEDGLPLESVYQGVTSTNNLGFRMIADIEPKRADERRVLLLGDSYLEANQVAEPLRFAEILTRRMREETDGTWNVINAGVVSGSPIQYLMQLNYWAEELQPDLVVTFIGPNDSPDDVRSALRYGVRRDAEGFPTGPEKWPSLALIKYSMFARYAVRYTLFSLPELFRFLSPERGEVDKAPTGSVHQWIELACSASEESKRIVLGDLGANILLLKEASQAIGADFAVVLIHYPFYFPDEPFYKGQWDAGFLADLDRFDCVESEGRAYEAFMVDFLRSNEIRFVSTYDRFIAEKRRNPERKLWHFFDYHYNPQGHKLVAEDVHGLVTGMIGDRAR